MPERKDNPDKTDVYNPALPDCPRIDPGQEGSPRLETFQNDQQQQQIQTIPPSLNMIQKIKIPPGRMGGEDVVYQNSGIAYAVGTEKDPRKTNEDKHQQTAGCVF
jgi:hypothetical protein